MAGLLRFLAIEVDLVDRPLRLLKGPSRLTFDGKTFVGQDPDFGVLAGVSPIADGDGDEVSGLTVTILPPDITSAAELANPAAQGRPVTVWVGDLDLITGQVVGTPDIEFAGEVDVPTLVGDTGEGRALEYAVTGDFEKLFEVDEGALLTNAFHQSVWPGELGCEFVTSVQRQLPIGMDAPRPAAVRDVLS